MGTPLRPKIKLREVNRHLVCRLCKGYYVDATTITECLHSFCRSCIIKYLEKNNYCPICEVQIHKTKPYLNLRLDKALQDVVYKLVPGLFNSEMARRRRFYANHPDQVPLTTPEQRGLEDRLIFSPEDSMSLSLEYMDGTEFETSDSVSSHSSDSGEDFPLQLGLMKVRRAEPASRKDSTDSQEPGLYPKRYLQCPAVVSVALLKKFLVQKLDLPPRVQVDIIHKRRVLRDHYTLMDVAYIFTWKRMAPIRLYYLINEKNKQNVACPVPKEKPIVGPVLKPIQTVAHKIEPVLMEPVSKLMESSSQPKESQLPQVVQQQPPKPSSKPTIKPPIDSLPNKPVQVLPKTTSLVTKPTLPISKPVTVVNSAEPKPVQSAIKPNELVPSTTQSPVKLAEAAETASDSKASIKSKELPKIFVKTEESLKSISNNTNAIEKTDTKMPPIIKSPSATSDCPPAVTSRPPSTPAVLQSKPANSPPKPATPKLAKSPPSKICAQNTNSSLPQKPINSPPPVSQKLTPSHPNLPPVVSKTSSSVVSQKTQIKPSAGGTDAKKSVVNSLKSFRKEKSENAVTITPIKPRVKPFAKQKASVSIEIKTENKGSEYDFESSSPPNRIMSLQEYTQSEQFRAKYAKTEEFRRAGILKTDEISVEPVEEKKDKKTLPSLYRINEKKPGKADNKPNDDLKKRKEPLEGEEPAKRAKISPTTSPGTVKNGGSVSPVTTAKNPLENLMEMAKKPGELKPDEGMLEMLVAIAQKQSIEPLLKVPQFPQGSKASTNSLTPEMLTHALHYFQKLSSELAQREVKHRGEGVPPPKPPTMQALQQAYQQQLEIIRYQKRLQIMSNSEAPAAKQAKKDDTSHVERTLSQIQEQAEMQRLLLAAQHLKNLPAFVHYYNQTLAASKDPKSAKGLSPEQYMASQQHFYNPNVTSEMSFHQMFQQYLMQQVKMNQSKQLQMGNKSEPVPASKASPTDAARKSSSTTSPSDTSQTRPIED